GIRKRRGGRWGGGCVEGATQEASRNAEAPKAARTELKTFFFCAQRGQSDLFVLLPLPPPHFYTRRSSKKRASGKGCENFRQGGVRNPPARGVL
ncbi:MAG: hypothetical protein BJ554DRAFT_1817, partial [Olpidium bornovanus]